LVLKNQIVAFTLKGTKEVMFLEHHSAYENVFWLGYENTLRLCFAGSWNRYIYGHGLSM
jgi:hypothetical protein